MEDKKPWTKPEIQFHPEGSEEYERLMALLREEDAAREKTAETG